MSGELPEPLPYQRSMVEFFKAEESDLWGWFSSTKARAEQSETIRLDLLKTTYRLEASTQPQLYAAAGDVLKHYGLQVPITFYRAQSAGPMNAGWPRIRRGVLARAATGGGRAPRASAA